MPLMPIAAVAPHMREVTIRGRLMDKSTPHNWSNDRGSGTMFSIIIMDSNSDTMSGRFFTQGFEKFYEMLTVGNIYEFSDGKVGVPTRTPPTTVEYEMTFDANARITLVGTDDPGIPNYSTKKVAPLETVAQEKDLNAQRDYLAIIHTAKPSTAFTTKKGAPSNRRDISIVDKSGLIVDFTFWGDVATKYQDDKFEVGKPILIQGARVSEFNGARSLQSGFTTTCTFDLKDNKAQALASWYSKADHNTFSNLRQITQNASNGGANGQQVQNRVIARDRFSDVDEQQLLDSFGITQDPQAWLNIDGYVIRLVTGGAQEGQAPRRPWYEACQGVRQDGKQCAKKVTHNGEGYRCDGCQFFSQTCDYRYITTFHIADESGARFVSAFNEQAQAIIGHEASELNQIALESGGEDRLAEIFASIQYKPITCLIRAYVENGQNGTAMVRYRMHRIDDREKRTNKLIELSLLEIEHFKKINQDTLPNTTMGM